MMNVLGVDPGMSGGIAMVNEEGAIIHYGKMPDTEVDLCDLLAALKPQIRLAFLESVHAMPKQGVSSTFKFGVNYGGLRMALIALRIPMETIQPVTWQRKLGCLTKGDKNISKRRAQELFPAAKVTHAVADALLIAEYGRRFLSGVLS